MSDPARATGICPPRIALTTADLSVHLESIGGEIRDTSSNGPPDSKDMRRYIGWLIGQRRTEEDPGWQHNGELLPRSGNVQ